MIAYELYINYMGAMCIVEIYRTKLGRFGQVTVHKEWDKRLRTIGDEQMTIRDGRRNKGQGVTE